MGNWYKVKKRINGRLYYYWQRTQRVGGSVKTENKYIGPASGSALAASVYSATAPETPERVLPRIAPFGNPQTESQHVMAKIMERERREDEHIQYGPLKARIERQKQAVRDVKRKTRGIKAVNPFLAQGIKRYKD
jgi:hypothetical protein